MCGIFAVVNDESENAAQTVLSGLKKLEYRGYDSWGVAIKSSGNKLLVDKHIGKIGSATTDLPQGTIGIGHTRWATHGGVTDANAHPHLDCQGKIAVIHNGIVENHIELKGRLIRGNHKFHSETDTEVISHMVEEEMKTSNLVKAVFTVFNSLSGSNAIGVLDGESETVVAVRNGSPLVIGHDEKKGQYFLGSDVPAFLKFTNKVYFLNDNEAVVLNKKGIKLYEVKSGKEIALEFQTLDWKMKDAEKSGYPHFMLKEINEQKTTIVKTTAINAIEINKVADFIKQGYKVKIVGCGTASYCALIGKYFFAEAGTEVEAYGAYEFLPFSKFVDQKTIVIGISQSGETADTLIALRAAKKHGAHVVAIINARGSTMERMADTVIPVSAGPEIAVVTTKALTSQMATLYLLSQAVIGKYGDGKNMIRQLSESINKWMDKKLEERIIELAKTMMENEHVYLIGKHLNYPATLEFALKMKESAYIHAEPFAAGELKHGVITLIQKGTPCFVLASNDEVRSEVLSSAAELKARGGNIIGVAPFEAAEFDQVIVTPDLGSLTIFANILVGQLLGYYLGIGRGADPDKPRNLAKSVTVK